MPCESRSAAGSIGAELTDCSPQGLGLVAQQPLAVGSQFLVKLTVAGKIRLLTYMVQHCQPVERARHRIGARFSGLATEQSSNDPEQIMAALLAEA